MIKDNPFLLKKLMYINARAKGFKRCFNIISRKIFEKILRNNPRMPRELLRCSFYPAEEEVLEEIPDEIERTVKYAVHLIKDDPKKKSLILTSDVKKQIYLNNSHYRNAKDISVKSGNDAIELINEFWELCTERGSC